VFNKKEGLGKSTPLSEVCRHLHEVRRRIPQSRLPQKTFWDIGATFTTAKGARHLNSRSGEEGKS
jgi:hypothetical protein